MEQMYRNMRIIIKDNYEAVSAAAGDIIAGQVKQKPDSVLGFATGSTPIGTYKYLASLHQAGNLDCSEVTSFNLDEYYPIEKTNSQSYHYFMNENLFQYVNVKPDHIHIPNGAAKDVAAECARYEKVIEAAGGIDLQLLGIGLNGHIGFNEPNRVFPKETNLVALDASTIEANSRFFDSAADVPKHALTMGIGTIFRAKEILLLISGAAKADIAEHALFGDIDPQVPGSCLQWHPNVTVILDAEAGAKVKERLARL